MRNHVILIIGSFVLAACGSGDSKPSKVTYIAQPPTASGYLTPEIVKLQKEREFKDLRAKMVAGEPISDSSLTRLAAAGDSLAAATFADRLVKRGGAKNRANAVSYYAQAARGGRNYAISPMLRIMKDEGVTLNSAQQSAAKSALDRRARRDGSIALTMASFYSRGHPFPRDKAEERRYLAMASEGNDSEAALKLATQYMIDEEDKANGNPQAIKYLTIAAKSDDLSIRTTAENLLRRLTAATPASAPAADETPTTEEG